jgi:hypothetical protein
MLIRSHFEQAGIVFLDGDASGGIGVRLKIAARLDFEFAKRSQIVLLMAQHFLLTATRQ